MKDGSGNPFKKPARGGILKDCSAQPDGGRNANRNSSVEPAGTPKNLLDYPNQPSRSKLRY